MILVTGGAGYIGSHVSKLLWKRGYEILVYDNLSKGHVEFVKYGNFVLGDLSDLRHLKLVFTKYDIEAVMHFAAYIEVGESIKNPKKYYMNNLENTLNLLNVMLDSGVKYLVFSSTCAIYGNPIELPIPEEHPMNPTSPYGKGKMMIEKILEDYSESYGLKYISLRYFNASGADLEGEIGEWHIPETHLIPNILDVVLNRKEYVTIFGDNYDTRDGTCIRDFIHVVDLAEAHLLALEYLRKYKRSDFFNLGNGKGFSVMEVINAVSEITGKSVSYRIGKRRAGDISILIANNKKAKDILGWIPKFSDLYTIIESAWKWHKKLYSK